MARKTSYNHSHATLYAGSEITQIQDYQKLISKISDLIRLHNKAHKATMAEFSLKQLQSFVGTGNAVLVVSDSSEPIGFAKLQYWGEANGDQILEFGSWIVAPGVQHKGLGLNILKETLDLAKNKYKSPLVYAIVANDEMSQSKIIFEQKLKLQPWLGYPDGIKPLINMPVLYFNLTNLQY